MQQPSNSLYFGIGLANGHGASQDLPIDVLSMILVAERLGVERKKVIVIADIHSRLNRRKAVNPEAFDKDLKYLTTHYKERFNRVVDNLGFGGWKIILASTLFDYSALFHQAHQNQECRERLYTEMELQDIDFLRTQAKVNLKIGWAFDSSGNLDEAHFDRLHKQEHPESDMSFIYVKPGITFNPMKMRMSPYFCDDKNARIGLLWHDNVEKKFARARERWGEQGISAYRNYLKSLVRLFDSVVEPTRKSPLEQKLQEILDRCLK